MLVVIEVTCNKDLLVAIDDRVMQQTSLRGNICRLQRICVGDSRGHMQQTIVGCNRLYGNATHKVRVNNAYCNQNQWLPIILSQREEFE